VRRSRDRFWAGDPEALDVLWTVLTTMCQVAAPLLPLTTEAVYRGLVGDDTSVHLTDWPDHADFVESPALVTAMDRVRDVCSATSAVRKAAGRRVRQPLTELTGRRGRCRHVGAVPRDHRRRGQREARRPVERSRTPSERSS
jgi:isoleucyl-tRNA synthetase